jgi:hypothetical protein
MFRASRPQIIYRDATKAMDVEVDKPYALILQGEIRVGGARRHSQPLKDVAGR